jgi:flagellar hook-basal body complex protein FliE
MIDALSSAVPGLGPASAASPVGQVRPAASPSAVPAAGPSFSEVLAEIAGSGLHALRQGEAAALAGIQGQASVQQVVQAVMSAEQSLQTAIAIRDKVVAAYQEISRMAI